MQRVLVLVGVVTAFAFTGADAGAPADSAKSLKAAQPSTVAVPATDSAARQSAKIAATVTDSEEIAGSVDTAKSTAFARCSLVTVPAEAMIYVDDTLRGKSPMILDSVTPGSHEVQIKKKGYYIKKIAVTFTAGQNPAITADLQKPARLAIATDPAGAVVHYSVNDSCITPCAGEKLKPGPHEITIAKEGFVTRKESIALASAANDSLYFKLTPTSSQKAAAPQAADRHAMARTLVSLGVFVVFVMTVLIVETTH